MTIQEKRQLIVETANERDCLTLTVDGKVYPARIGGSKLDYPYIYTNNELGRQIEAQISWALADRLAKGETNNVFYN